MAEGEKWKIQDVGRLLKESIKAILHGQFLLRLNMNICITISGLHFLQYCLPLYVLLSFYILKKL